MTSYTMKETIEIRDVNNYFIINAKDDDDAIELAGKFQDIELYDSNLILFLYKFINGFTIHKFKEIREEELYSRLMKLVKSKRKTPEECVNAISFIMFDGYEECAEDREALIAAEADKKLHIDINDYIAKIPYDEYVKENYDFLLTRYETIHDLILMQLEYCQLVNMPLDDYKIELWEDYDSLMVADWKRLEKDTVEKYENKEVSIYGIRKVRAEVARFKNITANKLTEFRPLKYTYETKYYTKKTEDI